MSASDTSVRGAEVANEAPAPVAQPPQILTEQVPQIPNLDLAAELAKPRLESILFFDSHNQTADGKTNLFGVFEQLTLPPAFKGVTYVNVFVRTAETINGPISISVTAPDKKPVAFVEYTANVDLEKLEPNIVHHIQVFGNVLFHVETEGIYWFAVAFRSEVIGGTGLMIKFAQEQG